MTTDGRVFGRSNSTFALGAVAIALSLCGCAGDTTGWFSKPLNVFSNNRGYSYSSLGQARQDQPAAANDLVDANGACPGYVAPASPPPVPGSPDAGAAPLGPGYLAWRYRPRHERMPGSLAARSADGRQHRPESERVAWCCSDFQRRPATGALSFRAGRLSEMDRVEEAQPPAQENRKTAKKKPAASAVPPKTGDKS